MKTQVLYSNEFNQHNDINHPENANRLNVMIDEIKKTPFYKNLEFITPKILSKNILQGVHSNHMIENIKKLSLQGKSWIGFDTYVCNSSYDIARLAAGGLLKLTKNVSKGMANNGFGLIRPPGHHATKNNSMGFCLFNNAAIVANELAKQKNKVLIFDFDVHHGNGTQEIFYDRKDVMYQSIHLSPHYPGTGDISEIGIGKGEGYNINAPLKHGNGNNAFSKILNEIFLPIAKQFKPNLIIVSAGFDSHNKDPLGGFKLTTNFFGEMIQKYQNIQSKIVGTLEGGYNLDWIGKCIVSILGQMSKNQVNFDESVDEYEDVDEVIKNLKNKLGNYWNV